MVLCPPAPKMPDIFQLFLPISPPRTLSDAADRSSSSVTEEEEERPLYAAIYRRDYYVNSGEEMGEVEENNNSNNQPLPAAQRPAKPARREVSRRGWLSRCQNVNVSKCQHLKVSRCQEVKRSRCQVVKLSRCYGVKVSGCQVIMVSKRQSQNGQTFSRLVMLESYFIVTSRVEVVSFFLNSGKCTKVRLTKSAQNSNFCCLQHRFIELTLNNCWLIIFWSKVRESEALKALSQRTWYIVVRQYSALL